IVLPVAGDGRRFQAAEVTVPAASVFFGVAVQYLFPETFFRHAYAVICARHGREVADNQNQIFGRASPPKKTQRAFFRVVKIHPLKPIGPKTLFVQSRLLPVKLIEVTRPALRSLMRRLIEQMPIKTRIVVPFTPLPEFAAHE